eukprot:6765863-Pyramimonas_sp.AAC.1
MRLSPVGWRFVSAFVVVTALGDMLDFRIDAPFSARELARAAAVRKLRAQRAKRTNPADDGIGPEGPIGD